MSTQPNSVRQGKWGALKVHRLLSLWVFGDVIYAVLPLFVLATVTGLLREPLTHFLQLKEWSFATIVLFGAVIRKFVRLKVEIQQTPTSYKLETGLQLFIVCLITSVLVLGLVVLAEKGIVPADKVLYLGYAQLFLFVMGMGSMLVAVIAEDSGLRWVEQLAGSVSRPRLLRRIHRELELAEWHVQYVVEAMDRAREHDSHDSPDTPPASSSRREEERWLRIASGTLDRLEDFLAHVRQGLKSYRTVPDTPKGTQRE